MMIIAVVILWAFLTLSPPYLPTLLSTFLSISMCPTVTDRPGSNNASKIKHPEIVSPGVFCTGGVLFVAYDAARTKPDEVTGTNSLQYFHGVLPRKPAEEYQHGQ